MVGKLIDVWGTRGSGGPLHRETHYERTNVLLLAKGSLNPPRRGGKAKRISVYRQLHPEPRLRAHGMMHTAVSGVRSTSKDRNFATEALYCAALAPQSLSL